MDPEVAQSPPPAEPPVPDDATTSPSGEKRGVSDCQDGDSSPFPPPAKKPKLGSEELGRVAEIVLVLSAMGRMRGGKDPSEAELGLMAEAREKLALICETLAPKDIVAGDAIGRVIEDLGLNGKARDQRLGFKVPKLSISEKLLFTKRKMEESKKLQSNTPTYTSHTLQGSLSSGTENRGALQLRPFQSDKLNQPSVSSGVISAPSSLGTVSIGNSGSITYQFGAPSELKTPTVTSALPTGHLVKDSSSLAVPKVERPQGVVELGSGGSIRAAVVQGNSSVNQPSVNAPTWSIQTQSASSISVGPEKNMTSHTPGKVQEASNLGMSSVSQAARDMATRPFITRAASGNAPAVHNQPPQGVITAPPSNYGNHYEIAKMVQKLLPPKLPEHPTWTPPSREYMNKALTCQICQITVNDVESVLLCDACEKGYHLKCLQSQNQRGIPKFEWHCQKCLAFSHGKPLPPKYGRVMRNMGTSKVTANAAGVQPYAEKKVGLLDSKVNHQQKVTPISGPQNSVAAAPVDNNHVGIVSNLQCPTPRETRDDNSTPTGQETHQNLPSEYAPQDSVKSVGPSFSSMDDFSNEKSISDTNRVEVSASEMNPASMCDMRPPSSLNSELPSHKSDLSSSLQNSSTDKQSQLPDCAEMRLGTDDSNSLANRETEKSPAKDHADSSAGDDVKIADAEGRQQDPSVSDTDTKIDNVEVRQLDPSVSTENTDAAGGTTALSSDATSDFQWIGNVLELIDGKAFYSSCCINGVTYKLKQHALFHSSQCKLEPSMLQAMWEDQATGMRWVNVNRCYFPGDLPDNVGHPFTEANEVFESNHKDTFMVDLIHGPCEVLHPVKYKEETERRNHLGAEANGGLRPVFLCKWFYDEAKGHFQAISS